MHIRTRYNLGVHARCFIRGVVVLKLRAANAIDSLVFASPKRRESRDGGGLWWRFLLIKFESLSSYTRLLLKRRKSRVDNFRPLNFYYHDCCMRYTCVIQTPAITAAARRIYVVTTPRRRPDARDTYTVCNNTVSNCFYSPDMLRFNSDRIFFVFCF